jgi:hypothetical protein
VTALKTQLNNRLKKVLEPIITYIGEKRFYTDIVPNLYLAGGAITSTIANEEPSDFDVFFSTELALQQVLTTLHNNTKVLDKLKFSFKDDLTVPGLVLGGLSSADEAMSDDEAITWANNHIKANPTKVAGIVYISSNAITFKNGLQLTFRFLGRPEAVFNTFDYEHCKVYFRLSPLREQEPVFCGDSLRAIATRELLYTGNSRFVLSALARMTKFSNRGWRTHSSLLFKLMQNAMTIDWTSLAVVEQELNGFYGITPAQVAEILSQLKKKEKFSLKEITELVEGL